MRITHVAALPAALCAAALLASTGCSSEPEQQPVPDAGVDMEAYFGLTVGRCYEYTTADSKQDTPSLGMLVEKIDTNQFPVPTYQIAYSTPSPAMQDMVAIDGQKLVLYKRNFPGGKSFIYDPPLTLMEAPIKPGARLTSTGNARIRDAAGTLLLREDHSLQIDIFQPDPIPLQLPIGESVTGFKALYSETVTATGAATGRREVRTLVPGTDATGAARGWVKVELNLSPTDETREPAIYKLQAVRDIASGSTPCGMTP